MSQTNILLEAGTNELEIVEFFIEEHELADDGSRLPETYRGFYGVNVAKVLEIIRMPKVTELPEVQHPCVLGAFNLRSHIIPLVDLGMWLGKQRADLDEEPKTIVTEFNSITTAFMVSGVNRIHRISWEEVEAPSPYVSRMSNHTVIGVVRLEERIVFLLDLEKIVANLNPSLTLRLDDLEDLDPNARYRALVVDDSALVREMLRDLLEKANFDVEIVNHGAAGWDRLVEFKQKADESGRPLTDFVQVVVSDIEMPMMDGHSLTKRIKEDPILKKLPVLLFSSLITDKLRHKGESVGADDQISKPEVTHLARRAIALIQEREGANTATPDSAAQDT